VFIVALSLLFTQLVLCARKKEHQRSPPLNKGSEWDKQLARSPPDTNWSQQDEQKARNSSGEEDQKKSMLVNCGGLDAICGGGFATVQGEHREG
jgi:hypothetical protein